MLTTTKIRKRLLSVVITAPSTTPLMTVTDGKKYANVTFGTEDDTLIESLIQAASNAVEKTSRRSLLTQEVTVRWRATSLPLRVYRSPIQEIVSVSTYWQGTETTETKTNFYIGGGNGLRPKIFFKDGFEFTASEIEEIEIVTKNGWGDEPTDVPSELIQAARLILNQFYDRRDNIVEGSANLVPFDAHTLMSTHIAPVI